MRYQSVSGVGSNGTVDLVVTEAYVNSFYLKKAPDAEDSFVTT